MRLSFISYVLITELGKGDNFFSNYDVQQLTVIVDFTVSTLRRSADVCSRGSILIKFNCISKSRKCTVTFVL